jgi:hypothetical protein
MNGAIPAVKATDAHETAIALGSDYQSAENNLLTAYTLKEGTSQTEADKTRFNQLADALGVKRSDATVRSLQLIAEQRFQRSSQVLTLFSTLLDKVDQLKQRLIGKLAQ